MGRRLFSKPSHLATAAAVLSASAEDGLTTQPPVSGASNRGALRLRASAIGAPTAETAIDIALQTGGLANGIYGLNDGVPGASIRWRNTGEGSTDWRGHTDNAYVTFSRVVEVGSAVTDYPCVSEPRRLGNGSIGFVRTKDGLTDGLEFCHKATRTGSWTTVSIVPLITVNVATTVRPAFVVLPSGRLVAWAHITTTSTVDAFYSDDHGATWSQWSSATRITSASTNATICAEVTGDSICVVTGGSERGGQTLRVYWSLDAGQTFTSTYTETGMCTVRTCVTATGQVLLATSASAATSGDIYPVLFGGGLGASLESTSVQAGRPQVALCTQDDGTIWLFENGYAADPLTAIAHRVSLDNGASFSALSSTATVYDNGTGPGTPVGPLGMVAGAWNGEIVLLLTTDVTTANLDNGIIEMHLGGYDSLTETYKSASPLRGGTNLYGALSYIADDLPNNLGWTKTDTGAGATATQTADGLNLVGTVANNTNYTINPGIFGTEDGFRLRYVFRVNSGGSVANSVATVGASHSDGVNRQWWKIRHSTDQIRLIDQSGTLATSSSATGKFSGHTEVVVAWAHDYPSGGGGTLSVLYRTNGSTHWTALATNQAIAEQAGSATEEVNIGGPVAGTAVDWDVSYLGLAEGAANLMTGFTNPTDLHGRPLSSALDFHVANGVNVGAFGGPGIQGDTYTVSTGHQFAARNIWLTPRLPCRWSSGEDGNPHNVVFHSAGNTFRGNVVTLHGTNMPRATMEWSATDSWASPAYSVGLSAEVWAGVPATMIAGMLTVEGAPWTPHRFRSDSGRRWFAEVTDGGTIPPTTTVYEITDNDGDALYLEGLPAGAVTDYTVTVFGDRMGAVLPQSIAYQYMRLSIPATETADGTYRVGYLTFNTAHEVGSDHLYDNGFVERYLPLTRATETTSGHVHVTVLGPEHPELRIAWGLQHRASSDYLERVVNLFRALRGDSLPVVFWRDTDDVSTLGLYRVQGPVVKENSYGELRDELARVAQLILREETT